MRKILLSFTTFDYWFERWLTLLSVSFIMALWIYAKKGGYIDVDYRNIILYFTFVATFNYLFNFEFTNKVTDFLKSELDELLLLPMKIDSLIFKKYLLPLILQSAGLGMVAFFIALAINVISITSIPLILGLLLIAHIHYYLFSISMAIIGQYINWSEYIGFAMRFIGQTWNGSFIPFSLFSGKVLAILKILPFFANGLFLQVVWGGFDSLDILNLVLISVIQILTLFALTKVLLKSYIKYSRI